MKYLLTVVIPTYNRANDLKECLSYVIPQVLPHKDKVHIYISDNASTDDTPCLIEGIMSEYPDIITYYRQEKNITASPNFNDAVHRVESEYVYMLSDDDFIVPECISFMLDCISKYPNVKYFYLNQYVADEDMNGMIVWNENVGKDYVTVYETGGELIKQYLDGPSCISANLFKKEVWVNATDKMKEDCPGYVWLSILFHGVIGEKSAFIHYPMFTARMPKVQRYAANWPWYYIKGLGQLFTYLDAYHKGIYAAWIDHQQKKGRRRFLMMLTTVTQNKKIYRERAAEIKVYINSPLDRIFYSLLVTVIPQWFARSIILQIIRATKLFTYIK